MSLEKVIFVDLETTGLNPKKNSIHQIGMVGMELLNGRPRKELFVQNILCQPVAGKEIESKALQVSNVLPEELKTRITARDAYIQVKNILKTYVNPFDKMDKFHWIGYNAGFDYDFMRQWFVDHDDKFMGSFFWFPYVDVMSLVGFDMLKNGGRQTMTNMKLETVCKAYKVEFDGQAHDALADIRATKELFFKLQEGVFDAV